ncbi:MAG: hypothetical protein PUC18_00590 [Prevotellaceae bacterium]|nr:hypothetical protein [Prevotellaceae bacterium]
MAQNKEQLEKLLHFIERLVNEPGNEDFANKLRQMLCVPSPFVSTDNSKLIEIEKYLGLDYLLDSASSNIDYSFVADDYIREQLISDFREMLRYRYGVRSHKIDFSEYCRYAMLQVEQLINYFYQNKFSSNEEVKCYINQNVEWAQQENAVPATKLSLAVKLSAFMRGNNKKTLDTLNYVRDVRNEQSHRGIGDSQTNIIDYRKKLITLGLPLNNHGEVNWYKIKDDEDLMMKYRSIDKGDYRKYCFLLWYNRKPFGDVIDAIRDIAGQIKDKLKE